MNVVDDSRLINASLFWKGILYKYEITRIQHKVSNIVYRMDCVYVYVQMRNKRNAGTASTI